MSVVNAMAGSPRVIEQEAADQFTGDMLGVGGTPAIASKKYLAALAKTGNAGFHSRLKRRLQNATGRDGVHDPVHFLQLRKHVFFHIHSTTLCLAINYLTAVAKSIFSFEKRIHSR